MKVIKGEPEGSFCIIHEGHKLHVMFLSDYLKQKGISRFMYNQREDAGLEFSLEVEGWAWLKHLAVLNYVPNGEILNTVISDKSGAFTMIVEGAYLKVMSVGQYKQLIGVKSKQVVQNRMNSPANDLEGVQVRCNKKSINFVVLKGEFENLSN